MGFRGSRVQIPPSRLSKQKRVNQLGWLAFCFVVWVTQLVTQVYWLRMLCVPPLQHSAHVSGTAIHPTPIARGTCLRRHARTRVAMPQNSCSILSYVGQHNYELDGITQMHADHTVNRASWDDLAASHGQDAYYDSEALIAGESSLIEEEESTLLAVVGGDLTGKQVLHLQCHLGFDAITLARRGARVTGVDFSTVALDKARSLADRCGMEVEWVCADATALPASLSGRFDLAWATFGILCWIADVRAWMRAAAGALAPGGRLVLIDGHPLAGALKLNPLRVVRPLVGTTRRTIDVGWDYATTKRTGPQVQFLHSLGDIVSAAAEAGLRVTHLSEHTETSRGLCIEHLQLEDDGLYRCRVDGQPLPILFTLVASA